MVQVFKLWEGTDGTTGDLTDKEKRIKTGEVCIRCMSRMPLQLPVIPPPGKVVQPNSMVVALFVICGNPKSDYFQVVF